MKYINLALYFCFISIAFLAKDYGYVGDLIGSFRYQWLLFSFIPATLIAYHNKKLALCLLTASLFLTGLHLNWQSYFLSEPEKKTQLTVKQINLSYFNPYIKKELAKLAKEDWDLLVVQEFNDQHKPLFESIKPHYFKFGPSQRVGFPMGIGVITRYPIISSKVVFTHKERVGYVELDLLIAREVIKLFAIHPPSPRTRRDWQLRNALLKRLHNETKDAAGRWVISGDFNTVPWSVYFPFKNSLSCSQVRVNYHTWHYDSALLFSLIELPIDNCIVSEAIAITDLQIEQFNGSDHKLLSYQITF